MANTLTGLIPTIYEALDVVSRELVGFIPCVTRDSGVERAALNQTVTSFVAPASTASDIVPAVTAPNAGDQTIGNLTATISKSRAVPIRWQGEQNKSISQANGGPGRMNIMRDQFTQAMRTLCNEIETDIAALHTSASRAYGTAATTPFASDVSATAQSRKILDDNGAPLSDRSIVIDTTAGANLRTLANLTKANESGTTDILRQGTLIDLHGFAVRESAQVKQSVAVGTIANATTNNAGYAVGATVLTLATAGTGVCAAGDILTFAGDTNKYVVQAVNFAGANPAAGDTITLAAPGLRVAMSAATKAITIVAAATRNMFFSRNALLLATRIPALPDEGDDADDRTTITDPRSGLSFEIALYKQYRQVYYEVACAWGVACMKREHLGILLG